MRRGHVNHFMPACKSRHLLRWQCALDAIQPLAHYGEHHPIHQANKWGSLCCLGHGGGIGFLRSGQKSNSLGQCCGAAVPELDVGRSINCIKRRKRITFALFGASVKSACCRLQRDILRVCSSFNHTFQFCFFCPLLVGVSGGENQGESKIKPILKSNPLPSFALNNTA